MGAVASRTGLRPTARRMAALLSTAAIASAPAPAATPAPAPAAAGAGADAASGTVAALGDTPLTAGSVRERAEGRAADRIVPRSEVAVEADRARCEQMKARIIARSTMVQYLLRALNTSGCPVDEHFLRCEPCSEFATGHFARDNSSYCGIVLCSNFYVSERAVEATIVHELVHAYDYCRAKLDYRNCAHHACTEVRASMLSGECAARREWNRGQLQGGAAFAGHLRDCVRQRATLSVSMNPNCQNPAAAVDQVLDTCMADKEPFGAVPKWFW